MPVPPVPVPPVPWMMTLRRSVLRQALGAAVRAVAPHAGFGVTQQHARQCGCGDRLRTATAPLGNAACGSRAVPRERAGSHGDSGAAEGSLFPPRFSSKAPGEVTLQTIPYSYLGLRATEWSRGSRAGQWHRGPCQRRDLAVPATESPGGGGGRCSNVCLGRRVAERQPRPGSSPSSRSKFVFTTGRRRETASRGRDGTLQRPSLKPQRPESGGTAG